VTHNTASSSILYVYTNITSYSYSKRNVAARPWRYGDHQRC